MRFVVDDGGGGGPEKTTNKAATFVLVRILQGAADEARAAAAGYARTASASSSATCSSSPPASRPALTLDNEDGPVLDGHPTVVGDLADAVRHFGILRHFWVTEGIQTRRAVVLTDSDMYLLDDYYKGGGSNMRTFATKATSGKKQGSGKDGRDGGDKDGGRAKPT